MPKAALDSYPSVSSSQSKTGQEGTPGNLSSGNESDLVWELIQSLQVQFQLFYVLLFVGTYDIYNRSFSALHYYRNRVPPMRGKDSNERRNSFERKVQFDPKERKEWSFTLSLRQKPITLKSQCPYSLICKRILIGVA